MIEIDEAKFEVLKEHYHFAKEMKALQEPLNKYEITELRGLIKEHIGDGYTNYLRLVTIYSIDRNALLGIYVRYLYQILLHEKETQQ
ncbi:hypothetical protein SUSP_000364 [Sulfurospirillum sp. 'SP']|nr:hypothetical protein [Sulfurospirillum sp. 'SP']WNY97946.1 hypothetical protein SUSP_000364 [Sulfurospirillum sp. 'SP']